MTDHAKPAATINYGDYKQPIASTGEDQFACIIRNRSGIDAGRIDMGARSIEHLSAYDQQDAVNSAYSVYEEWCDETGLTATRAAALPQGVWLPIDSAPRDGTMFLCWVDAVRYGEDDDGRAFETDVSAMDFCEWRGMGDGDGFWMPYASPHGDGELVTHWMPITRPTPPPAELGEGR